MRGSLIVGKFAGLQVGTFVSWQSTNVILSNQEKDFLPIKNIEQLQFSFLEICK